MKTIIEQLRKRHETTLDFYNTEKLTEKEMNILRSEMSFLLSLKEDAEAINFTDSSLQFKKIEKPTFEEFVNDFFEKESRNNYRYKKNGELWSFSQVTSRYKNMYE